MPYELTPDQWIAEFFTHVIGGCVTLLALGTIVILAGDLVARFIDKD